MSIVQFDRPPSCCLDASETGESTKYPWVGVVGDEKTLITGPRGEVLTGKKSCMLLLPLKLEASIG